MQVGRTASRPFWKRVVLRKNIVLLEPSEHNPINSYLIFGCSGTHPIDIVERILLTPASLKYRLAVAVFEID